LCKLQQPLTGCAPLTITESQKQFTKST